MTPASVNLFSSENTQTSDSQPLVSGSVTTSTSQVGSCALPVCGHSVFNIVVLNLLEGFQDCKANATGFLRHLSLQLRAVSTEARHMVDHQGNQVVFPVVERIFSTRLSPNAFFKGPGLALKKLVARLRGAHKAMLLEMFSLMPASAFQEVFTAKQFPCDGYRFNLETSHFQLCGYNAIRFQFGHSDSKPGLSLNFLFCPNSAQVGLLGHFDPRSPELFKGMVLIKTTNLIKVYPVKSGLPGLTAGHFYYEGLFESVTGNASLKIMGGIFSKIWRGVGLTPQGFKQNTSGKLSFHVNDGLIGEVEGVFFNEDGSLPQGVSGQLKRYLNSGAVHIWQGGLKPDGSMRPNSIGSVSVFLPSGNRFLLNKAVMGLGNCLAPGPLNQLEHKLPCGRTQLIDGAVILLNGNLDMNAPVKVKTYSLNGLLLKTQISSLRFVSPVSSRLFSE